MIKLVFISDTHDKLRELAVPDGDILVHCGDICRTGTLEELARFNEEMAALPHKHKIAIAGNHDWALQEQPHEARRLLTAMTYLQDEGVTVEGLRFWGSPWVPEWNNWAFSLRRNSDEMRARRATIPHGIDVLVTHTPPHGIRDQNHMFLSVGCEALRERVLEVKPRIHAFGHVHEDAGCRQVDETFYVNACSMNFRYEPINRPIVLEL